MIIKIFELSSEYFAYRLIGIRSIILESVPMTVLNRRHFRFKLNNIFRIRLSPELALGYFLILKWILKKLQDKFAMNNFLILNLSNA